MRPPPPPIPRAPPPRQAPPPSLCSAPRESCRNGGRWVGEAGGRGERSGVGLTSACFTRLHALNCPLLRPHLHPSRHPQAAVAAPPLHTAAAPLNTHPCLPPTATVLLLYCCRWCMSCRCTTSTSSTRGSRASWRCLRGTPGRSGQRCDGGCGCGSSDGCRKFEDEALCCRREDAQLLQWRRGMLVCCHVQMP